MILKYIRNKKTARQIARAVKVFGLRRQANGLSKKEAKSLSYLRSNDYTLPAR